MPRSRKRPTASSPIAMDDAAVLKLALAAAKPAVRAGLEAAVVAQAAQGNSWPTTHSYLLLRGWRLQDANQWAVPGGAAYTTRRALAKQVGEDLSPFAWLADQLREAGDRLEIRERPALHRAESVVALNPFARHNAADDDDL